MPHWLPVKYRIEFKTMGSSPKDFMARHLATPKKWSPFKKQKKFHEIQWSMSPECSKIQARYFRQGCIRSVWASGMELFANVNQLMRLNWNIQAKLLLNLKMNLLLQFKLKNHCKAS